MRKRGDVADDRHEQVRIEIARLFLENRADTFETHAGVDAGFRQRSETPFFVPVKLHEDKIPKFKVSVAVASWRAPGFAASNLTSLVYYYFRTGTAWTRITHLPEIVFCAEPDDPCIRQPYKRGPQAGGFVILFINRGVQTLLREFKHFRQQLPGVSNSFTLEIITE